MWDRLLRHIKELSGVPGVVDTWVYTFVEAHQTSQLKWVHFIVCKLYLEVDFKRKKDSMKVLFWIAISNNIF